MDVYCIGPAGIALQTALGWMGDLYRLATVYPYWLERQLQGEHLISESGASCHPLHSGWIHQERMGTRLAFPERLLTECLAELIEYEYGPDKDAEDCMDIMRRSVVITTDEWQYLRSPGEFVGRMMHERGGDDHILTAALEYLPNKSTHEIAAFQAVCRKHIEEARAKPPDALVVLERPTVTVADVSRCLAAIGTCSLTHPTDADVAYFGVFNSMCGTSFSTTNLPRPEHLLGQIVSIGGLAANTALAGAGFPMHVFQLGERVQLAAYTWTMLGVCSTEKQREAGVGITDDGIAVVALLSSTHAVRVTFAKDVQTAMGQMFASPADMLRVPESCQDLFGPKQKAHYTKMKLVVQVAHTAGTLLVPDSIEVQMLAESPSGEATDAVLAALELRHIG